MNIKIFLALLALAFGVQAKQPVTGIDYKILSPAWEQAEQTEKPVVYEFFGYTCPGCNYFQQTMHKTEKNNDFTLIRVPVVFHATWEPYARAFHALQLMGHTEKTHASIFNAIHNQGRKWRNVEQIGDWLATTHGIDKSTFIKNCQSFAVETMMRKADKMRQHMQVSNTPTIVINGQYKAVFKDLAQQDKNIGIIEFLLKQ